MSYLKLFNKIIKKNFVARLLARVLLINFLYFVKQEE